MAILAHAEKDQIDHWQVIFVLAGSDKTPQVGFSFTGGLFGFQFTPDPMDLG